MRGVVGSNHLHGTILYATDKSQTVGLLTERRIHPETALIKGIRLSQSKIMRRGLTAHTGTCRLRTADCLHTLLRRNVADVIAAAGTLGQKHIALHLLIFTLRAERRLSHILAMSRNHAILAGSQTHRLLHKGIVLHAAAVVRKAGNLRLQGRHIHYPAAVTLLRDGRERQHGNRSARLTDHIQLHFEVLLIIRSRTEIRHRADKGVTAAGRSSRPCRNGFLGAETGLTKMNVDIHEAVRNYATRDVHDFSR